MNAVLPPGSADAVATSVAFGSLALIDPGRWALTARRDDLLVGAAGGVFMLFFLWLIIRDAAKTEPPDEGESVH
jgi:hypothetical protein